MALTHVLWLGGPPGAGKTTVARLLARRHGLRLYSADTRTWAHRDRALAAGDAAALRWESLPPDRRHDGDPAELLAMSLHTLRGGFVVDDLAALPAAPLVVADGSCLPARAAADAGAPGRAVWLLPTEQAQRDLLSPRALSNGAWRLYAHLSDVIAAEAAAAGVATIAVDGTRPPADVLAQVEDRLAAALAAGPRAANAAERQALLREANQAVVDQVRGYYGRAWAAGEPEAVRQRFVCECGDPACTAEVVCTVAEAAAGPVLAH